MEKRYQVFVSSTFVDLQEERKEVMQALLELKCIPSGMELFPADDDDQWTLIRRVIDDCDYYLLIIGGRYGSTRSDGYGYTELEYRYAVEKRKPVIAFLHKDPSSLPNVRCEQGDEGKQKLAAFRDLAQKKVCKYWESPKDLGGLVSRSLINLIGQHDAVGWIRANAVASSSAAEVLKLKSMVSELEKELASVRAEPPIGAEDLAQGEDRFLVRYSCQRSRNNNTERRAEQLELTWNQIFWALGPAMLHSADLSKLSTSLDAYIDSILVPPNSDRQKISSINVNQIDVQTILIQLRALGLVCTTPKNENNWKLSPYGERTLITLRALKRPKPKLEEPPSELQ